MRATLELINPMQADGLIGKSAIGGAVGATFYLEPASTVDLDIFVTLPSTGGPLSLAPIYGYLTAHGGVEQDEYIVLGGWPVQFLPPSNDLELEAVEKSVPTVVEGITTRIMTAERLVAVALGRPGKGP